MRKGLLFSNSGATLKRHHETARRTPKRSADRGLAFFEFEAFEICCHFGGLYSFMNDCFSIVIE